MKVLVVYVGKESRENYDHGLQHGVWGFKKPLAYNVGTGDYILFGRGFTGRNVRLPPEQWVKYQIEELVWAKIATGLDKSSTLEWPDESREAKVIYPYRLRFDIATVNRSTTATTLSGTRQLPTHLAEALRLSAITNSGRVEEIASWPVDGDPRVEPKAPDKRPERVTRPTSDILIEIENFVASRGFVFANRVLRSFYASLRSKPFIILAGNSGTGKSRLVRLFAEASGATVENGRFTMIPVRPDWNDSSELLGYFDLNGDCIPGQLIAPLLIAHREQTKPFFVCLDEMNLARVEHYFSDFLSIIESRRRDGTRIITDPILGDAQLKKMKTNSLRPEAQTALSQFQVAGQPIGLPENLFIAGTVNMDETTQKLFQKPTMLRSFP